MANEDDITSEEPNYDFVPESFKGEDGTYDFEKFRASYDEAVSFKAQAEEAQAALPKDADGYAFAISEEHVLPEGFDPELLKQVDEEGNEVEFDINKMIDPDDPDLPLLKSALHSRKADPALMSDLASILANRELRNVMKMTEKHGEEMKALGPEGKSRIDTVGRALVSMLPEDQAKSILDGITTADALRGIESILKKSKAPPAAAPSKGIDNATASIDERLEAGLAARRQA